MTVSFFIIIEHKQKINSYSSKQFEKKKEKLSHDDSIQILLCCGILRLLWFRLLSARFLIGYWFVSRDNLQIKRAFVLGVPPTQQDF